MRFLILFMSLFGICFGFDSAYKINYEHYLLANPETELSLPEYDAISKYKNMTYVDINHFLRNGQWYKNKYDSEVELLKSGVKKLKAYKGITWRGTSFECQEELFTQYTTVGGIVSDPAYVSSSQKRSVAESFLMDNGEELLVLFKISGTTGRSLSGIGNSGIDTAEQEILFPAGTRFKVLSTHVENITYEEYELENTPVTVVELKELASPVRIFSLLYQ
jgi:hypothetical protein